MSLSMYQASAPVFTRVLGNLSRILDKGAAFAESRKIEPSVLINSRLAPDMLPLSKQVQIASDMVIRGSARLAGVDIPSSPDTETTFPELQARIAKARDFVKTLSAAQIDGSETKKLTIPVGGKEFVFTGQDYLFNFVLPNLFFHATATYLILRHNGVELGKMDFLGA
ncbi:MAG TPA: DUF1993 domain-containing protein [Methyloceanibacter sp.]|jgi:hypothetical protein